VEKARKTSSKGTKLHKVKQIRTEHTGTGKKASHKGTKAQSCTKKRRKNFSHKAHKGTKKKELIRTEHTEARRRRPRTKALGHKVAQRREERIFRRGTEKKILCEALKCKKYLKIFKIYKCQKMILYLCVWVLCETLCLSALVRGLVFL
jgi:hypothetical protein